MDFAQSKRALEEAFPEVLGVLQEYIRVPNVSPHFDAEWASNGQQEAAARLLLAWAEQQAQVVRGMKVRLVEAEARTPLLLITIDSTAPELDETCLLYGHFDKQPPLTEQWSAGLHPLEPVLKQSDKDGRAKLYGRGGADDGYSIFAAVLSCRLLQEQGLGHARLVIVVEGSEESGSPDLPFYLEELAAEIGTPSLVVCLDSGCGSYDRLWLTASLRGVGVGTLRVKHVSEALHSGASSGIVVETFRVLRLLLDRLEDPHTGVLAQELQVDIPEAHVQYAKEAAALLQDEVVQQFPFLPGVQPAAADHAELLLNRGWRPSLCVTGVDGIPPLGEAGNVMRKETAVKLSIRMPPSANCPAAMAKVKEILTKDPPYGAQVEFTVEKSGNGWVAPPMDAWLEEALHKGSAEMYGNPVAVCNEGGSIPFIQMLQDRFPGVQFAIVGVLGPQSNAHGPNESLDIEMCKNLIGCVSNVVHAHFVAKSVQ